MNKSPANPTSAARFLWTTALAAVSAACLDRPVASVQPKTQSIAQVSVAADRTDQVDLLVVVDNSGSMVGNQVNLMAQLGPMIEQLVSPPCISRSNPTAAPHACDAANADDVPQYPAVKDLHVGVISTDLGTAGTFECGSNGAATLEGDDGVLNPIRYGAAVAQHLPWNNRSLPPGFRSAACGTDPMRFPSFIGFCSNEADASCDAPGASASTRDPAMFSEWFRCNAGLYVGGCGIEQPLEAAWRALVHHDARALPGNNSRNAGFLREDALLAIVVLTDEEDGSVRLCDRDASFSAQSGSACSDARTVFDANSRAWSPVVLQTGQADINGRFYDYQPGSAQDPTWSLDRYYNRAPADAPNRWTRDLLSLKPGHPERIVFAAIAGVPLQVPTRTADGQQLIDWNALLGAPGPRGADDFVGRDVHASIEGTQASAGRFSMRGARAAGCDHVEPACRREGSAPHPSNQCAETLSSPGQYMAFPSRRVIEIARRFDEAPSCNGLPCRNGIVTSICSSDYRGAMGSIVEKIRTRLQTPCLQRALDTSLDSTGAMRATCVVREAQPEGVTSCDASRGRIAIDGDRAVDTDGRVLCEVAQIATHPSTSATPFAPVSDEPGWFYDQRPDPRNPACRASVRFTSAGEPRSRARVRLECIQRVDPTGNGDPDAGATR
ncbi:MAG: hypothetical protein JNK05_23080 [Myxococcales bacterium]|nr:hypothetical protein [Myxococcales bacterium]